MALAASALCSLLVARRLRHAARVMLGDLHQSDHVVIRALPSSRLASSARLEQQLRRALAISQGDLTTLVMSPIAAGLLLAVVVIGSIATPGPTPTRSSLVNTCR